jgi:hypothetical protein
MALGSKHIRVKSVKQDWTCFVVYVSRNAPRGRDMSWTIEDWTEDIRTSRPQALAEAIAVTGVRDSWADPCPFGRVDVIAEPAESWSVDVELSRELMEAPYAAAFLKEAVFGVMDVLLVDGPSPLLGVRLRVVGLVIDSVRSSQMAFRLAGRDAGKKIRAGARLRRLGRAE